MFANIRFDDEEKKDPPKANSSGSFFDALYDLTDEEIAFIHDDAHVTRSPSEQKYEKANRYNDEEKIIDLTAGKIRKVKEPELQLNDMLAQGLRHCDFHCWYCEADAYNTLERIESYNRLRSATLVAADIPHIYAKCKTIEKFSQNGIPKTFYKIVREFCKAFTDYDSPHITQDLDISVAPEDLVAFSDDRIRIFKDFKLVTFNGVDVPKRNFTCDDYSYSTNGLMMPIEEVRRAIRGDTMYVLRMVDGTSYSAVFKHGKVEFKRADIDCCYEHYAVSGGYYCSKEQHTGVINGKSVVFQRPMASNDISGAIVDTGIIKYVYHINKEVVVHVEDGLITTDEKYVLGSTRKPEGNYGTIVDSDNIKDNLVPRTLPLTPHIDVLSLMKQCWHIKHIFNIALPRREPCKKRTLKKSVYNTILIKHARNGVINIQDYYNQLREKNASVDFMCLKRSLMRAGISFVNGMMVYSVIYNVKPCARARYNNGIACTCYGTCNTKKKAL